MNQENSQPTVQQTQPQPQQQQVPQQQVPQQQTQTTTVRAKIVKEELNLKEYTNLVPKTIEELKQIQERSKRLYSKKKYFQPYPLQPPREKTEEEKKQEALQRRKDVADYTKDITYSDYYYDEKLEYRHVVVPKMISRWFPKGKLLTVNELLSFGVSQSTGWEHYMIYAPEPHILLFRRELNYIRKRNLSNKPVKEDPAVVPSNDDVVQTATDQQQDDEPVTSEIMPIRPIPFAHRSTKSSTQNPN